MALSKSHYVNIGQSGTFEDSETSKSDIDALFQSIKTKKLIIHFHGGLVSKTSGKETAERMMNNFLNSETHVVSFVWETGFYETVKANLFDLQKTELFKKIVEIVAKKVGSKLGLDIDGARGVKEMSYQEVRAELAEEKPLEVYEPVARGRASQMKEPELPFIENEVQLELEEEFPEDSELADLLETEAPQTELFDQKYTVNTPEGGERGFISLAVIKALAKIVISVIRRYIKKTHHDLYPTIVEEVLRELYLADFGKWMWGEMKEIAEERMWRSNTGLTGDKLNVGTYFLEKIKEHSLKNPGFGVDLIGHSAGSIAVCNLFKNNPDFSVRNIILMAPACTSRLFYDELLTKPERFKSLRMFTMTDEDEKKDFVLKGVYTHSLLYMVSGLFEDKVDTPILGMQRFFTQEGTFDDPQVFEKIKRFFTKANLIVPKTNNQGEPGFNCDSIAHGDFDNDRFTLASLKHIAQS